MKSQIDTVELSEQEAREEGLLPDSQTQEEPQMEQEEVESSYVESDCHHWNGVKLEPFSSRRQMAAHCLGLRFGGLTKEEIADGLAGKPYADSIQDAVIILYLCYPRGEKNRNTGMTDSIEESYAACDPSSRSRVRRRMMDWAEAEGIVMGSDQLVSAQKLMSRILVEVFANQFKLPKPEGTAPKGN